MSAWRMFKLNAAATAGVFAPYVLLLGIAAFLDWCEDRRREKRTA